MPEVASNKELLTDETFMFAETLKAKPGTDFLSMAAAQDTGAEHQTEQGRHSESRHSQKMRDSLAQSDSTLEH